MHRSQGWGVVEHVILSRGPGPGETQRIHLPAVIVARETAQDEGVVTDLHPGVDVPSRYRTEWREPFEEGVRARLHEGITVLDIGSGRNPTVGPAQRPRGTRYVGLDLSYLELQAAGAGAYDQIVVADVATPVHRLVGAIELAVSWQVFEHIKPLRKALDNIYSYLKPGGTLVSFFSAKWSAFGVVNHLIPHAVGKRLVERSMRRRNSNQPVFPAFYDDCSDRALRKMTAGWAAVEIIPLFRGANYFHFSRALTRTYLAYENTVYRVGLANLATHYLMIARR